MLNNILNIIQQNMDFTLDKNKVKNITFGMI